MGNQKLGEYQNEKNLQSDDDRDVHHVCKVLYEVPQVADGTWEYGPFYCGRPPKENSLGIIPGCLKAKVEALGKLAVRAVQRSASSADVKPVRALGHVILSFK